MKRARRYLALGFITLLMAVSFNNCAQPKFSEAVKDVSSSGDPRTPGDDEGGTIVNKSKTVNIQDISKLDVLVVIDNSGSMKYEQKNMGDRFSRFMEQIAELQWRVGIITTDMSSTSQELKDGRLVTIKDRTERWLDSAGPLAAQAQGYFSDTVQRTEEGSGYEQGIGATYRSIERAFTSGDANNGFFRDDAALAVVVVTDADETGDRNDPKNLKDRNRGENLVKLVASKWPGKPFIFNGIIVKSGDEACKNTDRTINQNEGYGVAYEKAAALTGGITGSVCEADYGTQLSSIGSGVSKVVRSIGLECAPVDADGDGKVDITVYNQASAQYLTNFTVSGSLLTFSDVLPSGVTTLNYNCRE
ncbi:hypothetical protein [Bdellovibrio sp. HCB2-146]|uniref:hypothetical protein n=1 Tax=Bdellovibrio sp. HCB2-146 TaxID=3394362 RepID=UPI0039BCB731